MIITTCAPSAEQIAANEVFLIDSGAKFVKRLSQGVCLFKISKTDFFTELKKAPPVFIRHIMPVLLTFDFCGIEEIIESLKPIFNRMDMDIPFSVQTRVFTQNSTLTSFSFNGKISEHLVKNGFTLDVKKPVQIISIIEADGVIYAGLSTPVENMSKWSGGAPSYAKDGSFISRAEFKLLEALEVFGINLKAGQNALDLGAAPGGWSKILLMCGLNVTAVDPAGMSELLTGKITHIKASAQHFFKSGAAGRFDIITNDMKMDVDDSLDILFDAKKHLADGGIIITTMKLPEKNQQKNAVRALNILKTQYSIIGARQLFHNRSEICAAAQKKA